MTTCVACGLQHDVSARTYRDIKAGRVESRCALHRGRARARQTRIANHRRFWLRLVEQNRFTMDEIVMMGRAIEQTLSIQPSKRAQGVFEQTLPLTASGAPPGPRELGGR